MALEEILQPQFAEPDRGLDQDQVIAALQADPAALSDLELVNRCIWQLNAAAAFEQDRESKQAELITRAKGDLAAAVERPGISAAFADSFSHPRMVDVRLQDPTSDNLDAALEELFRIKSELIDQRAAVRARETVGGLQRLDGPTPWDTFFAIPGDPDKALMPLYGSRGPEALALGPIEGGDLLRSDGGQALLYPVGGYDRLEAASTVVVAQTLADGLAIDAALQGRPAWAVVVASAPRGLVDVCFDINQALAHRAAVAAPADRESVALVAALSRAGAPDSEAIKRLALEGPRMGTAIIGPSAAPSDDTAAWSKMTPDAIAESLGSAGAWSRRRLEDAAARPDERLDHGSGFREGIRTLRESTRETPPTPTLAADTPAKVEQRTHSAARRI